LKRQALEKARNGSYYKYPLQQKGLYDTSVLQLAAHATGYSSGFARGLMLASCAGAQNASTPQNALVTQTKSSSQMGSSNGQWAFTPERDTFSSSSLLDLRGLNEKVAGESGFVRRSADGNSFVLGNGKPARFWSITTYQQREKDDKKLAHHARWLAKRGVNMVRSHGQITGGEGSKLTDINADDREQIWRLVAAMKKEGIYTTISPYWSHPVNGKHLKSWGVPGDESQGASALLFFDKTLQTGYKSWVKQIFAERNPYTGIRLADDPAVALIQLQNEDSMLFWTMQGVKGVQLTAVEKLFAGFLTKKYGSLAKASAAWGNPPRTNLSFRKTPPINFPKAAPRFTSCGSGRSRKPVTKQSV
jgi:hypothetical protein